MRFRCSGHKCSYTAERAEKQVHPLLTDNHGYDAVGKGTHGF